MKNFFLRIKNWFVLHAPTRRRLIQIYAALLYNANIKGYISGSIYTGNSKYACVPGMNCYSCPGAVAACPLGALQNALASSDKRPAYFMLGILGLFGLMFARTICGFLCPVGLGQDLLYKIKSPKVRKNKITRILSYLKYVLLVVLVIAIPVVYSIRGNGGTPGFCKTICPAGTFGGGLGLLLHPNNRALLDMLGPIFTWKFCVMVAIIVAAVFLYRPFCRFLCPLGAIYGFFNRIALIGVKLDEAKCTDCGLCVAHCKMDIKKVGDHECINCGECMSVCPAKAIRWKGSKIFLKGNELSAPASTETVDIRTMRLDFATDPPAPAVATATAASSAPVSTASSAPIPSNVRMIEGETAISKGGDGGANNDTERKSARKPKGKRFWMEFAAWATAIALLITALVYFNFIDVTRVAAGASENMKLPSISVTVDDKAESLASIYGEGSTFIILTDGGEASIPVITTSMVAYADFKADYSAVASKMRLIAVYPEAVDGSFIERNELGGGDMMFASVKDSDLSKFAEMDEEHNEESISYPTIIILNSKGIVTKRENAPEVERLADLIQNANTGHEVGSFVPSFNVRKYGIDADGTFGRLTETFNPYDNLGKVTVINFWATWCGPCVAEIPSFNRIANEFSDVTVLAIHGDSGEQESERKYRNVAKFISEPVAGSKDSWSEYKILFAQDNLFGMTCLTYELFGGGDVWPMTFIVGKDGIITFVRMGSITYETLKKEVQKALDA